MSSSKDEDERSSGVGDSLSSSDDPGTDEPESEEESISQEELQRRKEERSARQPNFDIETEGRVIRVNWPDKTTLVLLIILATVILAIIVVLKFG